MILWEYQIIFPHPHLLFYGLFFFAIVAMDFNSKSVQLATFMSFNEYVQLVIFQNQIFVKLFEFFKQFFFLLKNSSNILLIIYTPLLHKHQTIMIDIWDD